jgi:large subunit ribosomal protein L4
MQKKINTRIEGPRASMSGRLPSAASKIPKLTTDVFNAKGEKVDSITLPTAVFGAPWNADLVHEVVIGMQSNARASTAHTKNRADVRGGGKKPWKQKGTGRARHGSIRSPIWVGGGVAHGPRSEKDYSKKINQNVRAKALASVFSKKYADGGVLFVDSIVFDAPKTKDARALLVALGSIEGKSAVGSTRKNTALIVIPELDVNTVKSFRNVGNVLTLQAKDVNPVELLTYKYVVVADPKATLRTLEHRVALKKARAATVKK